MDNKPNDHTPPSDNTQSAGAATPDLSTIFDQIAEKIIEQQEAVIGPIAVDQAKQIQELKINWPQHEVDVTGNPQEAIDDLVEKFKELFGQIAVQVSKEVAGPMLAQLPANQIPDSLK